MKHIARLLFTAIATLLVATIPAYGQNQAKARQILDRAAAIITNAKQGASASFSTSGGSWGGQSGTIYIKGSKFHASTRTGKIWNDGHTQWTYVSSTDEVTITNANRTSQTINPYSFINLYRSGYKLSLKNSNGGYEVHMTATSSAKSLKEAYITLTKNYIVKSVRLRQRSGWTTIRVNNFSKRNVADNVFRFTRSKCPGAEIIDLR